MFSVCVCVYSFRTAQISSRYHLPLLFLFHGIGNWTTEALPKGAQQVLGGASVDPET